jgi:hypothetical protein
MATRLAASKTYRLPEETVTTLRRLRVVCGKSETALISILSRHFEAAIRRYMTASEQRRYALGQLIFNEMKAARACQKGPPSYGEPLPALGTDGTDFDELERLSESMQLVA